MLQQELLEGGLTQKLKGKTLLFSLGNVTIGNASIFCCSREAEIIGTLWYLKLQIAFQYIMCTS
jgi:hypothetical protein